MSNASHFISVPRMPTRNMKSRVMALGDTIDDVRKKVPPYAARFDRNEGDDPCIIETWF